MKLSFALVSLLALAALSPVANAQSRFSLAIQGATNLDLTESYAGFDSGFSSTGAFVSSSATKSWSGQDSSGVQQEMTFNGFSSSQADYGRLRTKANATVGNTYYNPGNAPYYDGNADVTVDEEGSPDSFLVAGSAGFTDLLSFGQGAAAGYKAQYVFFIEGMASGDGISAILNAKIGNNATEEFLPDLSGGRVAQTVATQKYTIDSLRQQTAEVSFTTRFDASTFDYADGSTITGAADFSSTITLTAIYLYDANDNLVSNYPVTGASGTTYPGSQPVPEPATLAILGVGAVAMLRRRRKA